MISHFTTACLLSQNCLLFQQLPHISVSNAFNLRRFQFSFFSAFCHGQGTEFISLESTIQQYCHISTLSHSSNKCVTMVFTSDMQITIVIKLTGRM